MPLPASLKLFIEPTLGVAYSSFTGSTQVSNPSLFLGDRAQVEIYLVKDTGVPSYPREEIDYPVGLSLKVALGPIDESPTGGTWTLSYGGNTTSAIPYNATTAQLQTALNALASITSAGGVTVTKVGDNYNILFNSVGARTELTTNASSLTPLSTAGVATLQVGDGSKPQIYLVHLQRTVAGLATTFTQVPASSITVSTITAWDNIRATFRVAISPDPKGGTFSLNFDALTGTDVSTSAISVGASAVDVQNALNVAGSALADKVSVQQLGAYSYDITVLAQPGTNGLTANSSGLLSFNGYTGELNLNTSSALALLDGAESVATFLEVEITSDSKPITVLQIPVTLKNAVTDEGSVQPLVLESYLTQVTADGRYLRISNNLSEATASTVRTNIGVYSTGQVDTALALKSNLASPSFTGVANFNNPGNYAVTIGDPSQPDFYNKQAAGVINLFYGLSTEYIQMGAGGFKRSSGGVGNNYYGLLDATSLVIQNPTDFIVFNVNGITKNNVELYSRKAGDTFTGKVNFTSVSGAAGLNIGIGGTSTSALTAGDLWISTGGANLNFRDGTGAWKVVAALSNGNVFSAVQTIDVSSASTALRVTQRGAGDAIRVEDSTTPDATAFIVDSSGRVGIGMTPDASSSLSIDGTIYPRVLLQNGAYLQSSAGVQFTTSRLTDLATQTNPFTGNLSSTDYPSELIIYLSGVGYAVPARPI